MAIAPLNKFLTIAVPVAPGQQELYKAPVGTSAIVLFAQVANVGVNTFPTVTFTHRRTSVATRTAGNVRNNRIIKDGEIPPNDSLILIDGRLVLQRNAVLSDSIVISGEQTGITTINDVKYDHTTGLTTVTTQDPHNFSVNDEITMAGIAFTCDSTAGITSSIFPAPQVAFTVNKVGVGSTNFETNTGIVKTLPHTFRPSLHNFIRAEKDAITVTSGAQNGNKIQVVKGTTYDSVTGILSVTAAAPHNLVTGNTIQFTNESLVFKCSQDNFFKEKKYPRSTDPAANGNNLGVTTFVGIANTFTVDVGVTTTGGLVGPLQMEFICSILENSTS
jgi:hypothetical protein|tara:strand:+ start:16 stop:1011 length:996 start_codon:yes stop_codon:yes gene_type:complete